jgi:hypothetical protein
MAGRRGRSRAIPLWKSVTECESLSILSRCLQVDPYDCPGCMPALPAMTGHHWHPACLGAAEALYPPSFLCAQRPFECGRARACTHACDAIQTIGGSSDQLHLSITNQAQAYRGSFGSIIYSIAHNAFDVSVVHSQNWESFGKINVHASSHDQSVRCAASSGRECAMD